jgi:hypothetical protein
MTKPLSPAALATWNAFLEHSEWEVTPVELNGVAAALRAAADQVVPPSLETEFYDRNPSLTLQKAVEIRQRLLAIAAELEGGND